MTVSEESYMIGLENINYSSLEGGPVDRGTSNHNPGAAYRAHATTHIEVASMNKYGVGERVISTSNMEGVTSMMRPGAGSPSQTLRRQNSSS